MESVPTQLTAGAAAPRARGAVPALLAILLLSCGCTAAGKLAALKHGEKVDPNQPTQMAVTWNPKVVYAADPTRGGAIMPVLTGRMYLFAANPAHPLVCDGQLTVDLWDHTPQAGRVEPKMLEQWVIDPVTFAKLVKEDIIGMGYSLGLPWSTYRQDIGAIHMIVRFDPAPVGGKPHILQQSSVTVDHTATKELQMANMVTK